MLFVDHINLWFFRIMEKSLFCAQENISRQTQLIFSHDDPFLEDYKKPPIPLVQQRCGSIQLFNGASYQCTSENPINGSQLPNDSPAPLINFSNNCWLNSVLQLLLNLPDFISFFVKNHNFFFGKRETIFILLAKMFLSYTKKDKVLILKYLKEIKGKLEMENSTFVGLGMQDPSEALLCMLNILEKEMRLYLKLNSPENHNLIKEMFSINIKTTFSCLNCFYSTEFYSEELMLCCQIKESHDGKLTVSESIKTYLEEIRTCMKCESQRCHYKSSFSCLPKLLIIVIKRAQYVENVEKKNREAIELDSIIKVMGENEEVYYSIYRCIIHVGNHCQNGHYLACLR